MEIKNVENHIEANYPKQNEINNEKLKTSIPKKWAKLGIAPFVFSLSLTSNVYAIVPSEIESIQISGDMAPRSPIFSYGEIACLLISIIATVSFLINLILIVVFKIKSRKGQKEKKISIKFKISIIISFVIAILSTIGRYILSNMR